LLLFLVELPTEEPAEQLADLKRRVEAHGPQRVGAVDDAQAAPGSESNELSEGPTDAAELPPSPSPVLDTAEPFGYRLHREPACWVLVFQGGRVYLKPEIGLAYVAFTRAALSTLAGEKANSYQYTPGRHSPENHG